MKASLAILALIPLARAPLSAQLPGDSIRLRILPLDEWTHGRLVSLDDARVILSNAGTNQSYSLRVIDQLEIRRRKRVAVTLLGTTLACMAGAGLAIATRPPNRQYIFGSAGAALAASAGLGFGVGAIELGISPWHWKRVHLEVKAAT